ncbi:MAG TPA: lysylphosphatidylglycerol synthase transmembrane domain-containing protein [Anaerolineaceae bacterium]
MPNPEQVPAPSGGPLAEEALAAAPRERKISLWRVLGTVLSLGLLVYLIYAQGWNEFASVLRRVPLSAVVFAFVLLICSRVCVTLRWYTLLRSAKVEISFWQCFRLMFMGNFSSNFLPSTVGGDLVRLAGAIYLKVDAGVSAASLVLDRLVGMAGMSSLAPFGLVMVFHPLGAVVSPRFAAGIFPALLRLPGARWLYQRLEKFVRNLLQSALYWLRHPTSLLLALLCTYGHMLFTFLMTDVLLSAMHQSVSLWRIGALWSLSYFVSLVPVSINGLGLQELSISYLYSHFGGVTPEAGLALAVMTRLLFLLASLPGVFFLPDILRPIPRLPATKPEQG